MAVTTPFSSIVVDNQRVVKASLRAWAAEIEGGAPFAMNGGSAALPGLHPVGDTNTGLWAPAADTLAVSTGGVETMRFNSSGHVVLPINRRTQRGAIFKGGNRFMHDYDAGNNGTVTVNGLNTFLGPSAGNFTLGETATSDFEGSILTGLGYGVLKDATKAHHATGVGAYSLFENIDAYGVTAAGTSSMYHLQTGSGASAFGFKALLNLLTANGNNAFGLSAGESLVSGLENCIFGANASYYGTANSYCAIFGNSGAINNQSSGVVAIGFESAKDQTTGPDSTFVGKNTGRGITASSGKNTIVGANVTGLASNLTKTIILADGDGRYGLFVNSNHNMGLFGATSFGTSAVKVLCIPNGTAPATAVAGHVQIWVEAGALKAMGGSGTITPLAAA